MVSSGMANDQLVGKRNAPRAHLCIEDPHKRQHSSHQLGSLCPGSTPVAQYDSYRSKNRRNKQVRGCSEKRTARKARLYSTTSTSASPTYPCPECGRVRQARIAPISHLRTPRVNQTTTSSASSSNNLSSSSETMDEQHEVNYNYKPGTR